MLVVSLWPDALREAQSQNKDLSRQVQELVNIRNQLQIERDGLSADLSDTKDALRDALARLDAANAALVQLRSDMEHRLREKDDELENIRYGIRLSEQTCLLKQHTSFFLYDRQISQISGEVTVVYRLRVTDWLVGWLAGARGKTWYEVGM